MNEQDPQLAAPIPSPEQSSGNLAQRIRQAAAQAKTKSTGTPHGADPVTYGYEETKLAQAPISSEAPTYPPANVTTQREPELVDGGNPDYSNAPAVELTTSDQQATLERRGRGKRHAIIGGIGVVVVAVAATVGIWASKKGSSEHENAGPSPKTPSASNSPFPPRTSASESTTPSETTGPSQVLTPFERGREATEDLLEATPEVAAIIEKYHLEQGSQPYTVYLPGTQRYATENHFPVHYYNLRSLTAPLKISDYENLVPVFIANEFLSHNEQSVHLFDMGEGMQFPYATTPPPTPAFLFAPELGRTDAGKPSDYYTFATKGSVYMGGYDGNLSQYKGQAVIHVDINNIPVKAQTTKSTDGTLGALDNDAQYPKIIESGPVLNLHLEFDPQTNNVIAKTENWVIPGNY